jgi:alanine-synthesizing transaminase
MLEVCSTTLPQYVIPEIYENKNFKEYLAKRVEKYKLKSDIACEYLSNLDCILVIRPK